MRWSRYALALGSVLAVTAILGCTVYTGPPRLQAEAGVAVRPPAATVVADSAPPSAEASIGVFYSTLSPYGEWFDAPVCGRRFGRVWRPSRAIVGGDFVPYRSGGEWVATDQGWAFESDWDWGWAPFHYGRWCDDPRFGWVWVPGTEWAPSWVDWRHGGGYIGWAPLPPVGVVLSGDTWVFVDEPHFAGQRVTRYALPRERIRDVVHVARPVNRTVQHQGYSWQAGPPPSDIHGAGGGAIRPVHVAPPARGHVRRVDVRSHR